MNSYKFVNKAEMCKFKAKKSEINAAPLCLGNVSKGHSIHNRKKSMIKSTNMSMIFQLITTVLMLMIFWVFVNV